MFSRAIRSAIRPMRAQATQQTKRHGSSGGPPPVYEGFEAKIRAVCPEDKHVVMGVLGTYFGIYMLIKLVFGGGSDEEAAAPVVAAAVDTQESDIPSALTPAFESWSKQPGNMKKWEDSLAQFEEDMKVPSKAAKWEAQFQ
eukprot:g6243.t1